MNVTLRVDTNVMKDQANLVSDDVKKIDSHWKSICKLIQGTRNYWEGEASDTHFKIFHEVEPEVTKVIKRLNDNHIKLQIEAGVYEDTEGKAAAEGNSLPDAIF